MIILIFSQVATCGGVEFSLNKAPAFILESFPYKDLFWTSILEKLWFSILGISKENFLK